MEIDPLRHRDFAERCSFVLFLTALKLQVYDPRKIAVTGGLMKRFGNAIFVLCAVYAVCGEPLWAQGTAQISGTVLDPSGAVLPGVSITATATNTGISRNKEHKDTKAQR